MALQAHNPRANIKYVNFERRKGNLNDGSGSEVNALFANYSSSNEDARDNSSTSTPPEDTKITPQSPTEIGQPKQYDTSIRLSFPLNQFVRETTNDRPSLAGSDTHPIPPRLPVDSSFRSSFRSSKSSVTNSRKRKVAHMKRCGDSQAATFTGSTLLVHQSFYKVPNKKPRTTEQEHRIQNNHQLEPFSNLPGAYPSSFTSNREIKPTITNQGQDISDPMKASYYIPRVAKISGGYGFGYEDYSSSSEEEDDEPIASRPSTPIINQDTSFRDIIVIRDTATNFFTQPTELHCTNASLDGTIRIKNMALALLAWDVSEDIYHSLCNRLERMVRTQLDRIYENGKVKGGVDSVASLVHSCAVKLKDSLARYEKERVEMGECESFVRHEGEWADWFVEAARVGVLHLKVKGCRCRPEWAEPEE